MEADFSAPSWLSGLPVVISISSGVEWKSSGQPLRQLRDANHSDPTPGLIQTIVCSCELVHLKIRNRMGIYEVNQYTAQVVLSDEAHCPKLSIYLSSLIRNTQMLYQ